MTFIVWKICNKNYLIIEIWFNIHVGRDKEIPDLRKKIFAHPDNIQISQFSNEWTHFTTIRKQQLGRPKLF